LVQGRKGISLKPSARRLQKTLGQEDLRQETEDRYSTGGRETDTGKKGGDFKWKIKPLCCGRGRSGHQKRETRQNMGITFPAWQKRLERQKDKTRQGWQKEEFMSPLADMDSR